MNRRILFSAVARALLSLPFAVKAQQAGKVPRIGYMAQTTAELGQPLLAAFRQGLRERGWVDGQALGLTIPQSTLLRADEVMQ